MWTIVIIFNLNSDNRPYENFLSSCFLAKIWFKWSDKGKIGRVLKGWLYRRHKAAAAVLFLCFCWIELYELIYNWKFYCKHWFVKRGKKQKIRGFYIIRRHLLNRGIKIVWSIHKRVAWIKWEVHPPASIDSSIYDALTCHLLCKSASLWFLTSVSP